jgi:hypothetical protein
MGVGATEHSRPGLTNVCHASLEWQAERIPWHVAFSAVPIFIISFARPASPYCAEYVYIYIYIYISDTVQTVYVLPLVPNNTAVKRFYTNLERCEVLSGYLSLGAPAWRWLDQYVTSHKTFTALAHTHRLFAGVGSGSGRGVFHTYRHYRCRRSVWFWKPHKEDVCTQKHRVGFIETEVFKTVVRHRQVQTRSNAVILKMISQPPARRPTCRVQVRHANLPDRQFGRTGCVWQHPFIYIAADAGVGPGSGFAGVCASALSLRFEQEAVAAPVTATFSCLSHS